jgi:hypothetical protein
MAFCVASGIIAYLGINSARLLPGSVANFHVR